MISKLAENKILWISFAVTIALGGKVPYIFDIRPRTMYQQNAELFYPEPALEPIDWDTIKAGGSPRAD